jgi:ATP-binding cassette subfamily B protein
MSLDRNTQANKLAIRHYIRQMRLDWKMVAPAFLLPALGTILVFYVPALIVAKLLTKYQSQNHVDLNQALPYIGWFILLWALGEVCWRVGLHYVIRVETSGLRRLYMDAMDYLFQKDVAFFNDNFAGSLTKRVINYSTKYYTLIDTLFFSVFASYIPILFAFFILWRFSPILVLGLLAIIFCTAIIIVPLIKKRQKLVAVREDAGTLASGYVADMIGNIDTIKAFSGEGYEARVHERNVQDLVKKTQKSWDYHNMRIDVAVAPFSIVANALGLALAIYLSSTRGIGIAVVFVTFNYYAGVTRTMWEFNNVFRNLESVVAEGAQFTELLLEEPKVKDGTGSRPFKTTGGSVEFNNVRFRYADSGGEHLFNGLNLNITSGEKVALVGHSGGGKSTITKLLLRFMDIDGGKILIDSQNIADVKQQDLRSAIAYVPQEPSMFHRTLAENIRYGKMNASDEDIQKAAKAAHAHEFIKDLPQGYKTLVGERGVKLSGGQRQRIAIARAMIKDAPILVLDEATSALDSESEKLIQDALWKLMERRTAIVIAHRLSTIQKMDRIIVLSEGEVIEEGNHQELLKRGGVYASLWAHQSGGFLED